MTLLWKPLLATSVPLDPETGDFRWELVPMPCYASPKMDGYRAMVQRGVLVSRNGLPVLNKQLQARYGRKQYEGLDGELTSGHANAPDVFNRTSRVVRKATADASDTVFNVIDVNCAQLHARAFSGRLTWLLDFEVHKDVFAIKQTLIKTVRALKAYEAKALAAGWEGVMLRDAAQGPYPQKTGKENRSTLREGYLLRLKRFDTAEATIEGIYPLEHNLTNGKTAAGRRSSRKAGITVDDRLIGSAILRDVKTKKEFSTSVASNALRSWAGWADPARWRGKVVRYKWQVCGTVDKPRINTCDFAGLMEAE